MKKHGMFRSDSMAGTVHGKNLVSVRVAADIDNGCVVAYGDYEAGQREVRTCKEVAANTPLNKIAILGSEEVNKAVKYDTVGDFYNKAGSIARGYIPEEIDVFSITAECFDGEASVGTIFELQASDKLKAVASATEGSTTVGVCEAVEFDGATTWYVVRV